MESAGSASSQKAANRKQLNKRSIEGPGEQIFQAQGFGFSVQVRERHLDIPAEFPQNLTACATRRSQYLRVGRYGDALKFMDAFGNCFEYGDAFGAHRQAVRGVLDIATGEHLAVFGFQCRTHLKMREGSVSVLPRVDGSFDQLHSFGRSAFKNRIRVSRTRWPVSITSL